MYKIIVSISLVTCFLMSFISTIDVQADQKSMDYLKVVQQYAEIMLEKGRDRYGKIQTPLFAATLDRNTMALPEGETLKKIQNLERGEWGIRRHDRMITGANPMHDQNLYQILYALTKITGDKRYAVEADQTLKWFWEHCQSKNTGLMAWGEHIGWDFYTETIINKSSGTTHEYFRPWILWDKCYALDPQACENFALGVWEHQIGDRETGNFSRHANYEKHGPGKNSEYPRHGGFYIATWAYAYKTRIQLRSATNWLLESTNAYAHDGRCVYRLGATGGRRVNFSLSAHPRVRSFPSRRQPRKRKTLPPEPQAKQWICYLPTSV